MLVLSKETKKGGLWELRQVIDVDIEARKVVYGPKALDFAKAEDTYWVRTNMEVKQLRKKENSDGYIELKDINGPAKCWCTGMKPEGHFLNSPTEKGDDDDYEPPPDKTAKKQRGPRKSVPPPLNRAPRKHILRQDTVDKNDDIDSDDEPLLLRPSNRRRVGGLQTPTLEPTLEPTLGPTTSPRQSEVKAITEKVTVTCEKVDDIPKEMQHEIEEFYNEEYGDTDNKFIWTEDVDENPKIKGFVLVQKEGRIIQAATISMDDWFIFGESCQQCAVAELGDLLCVYSNESSRKIIQMVEFFAMQIFGARALFAVIADGAKASFAYEYLGWSVSTIHAFNMKRVNRGQTPSIVPRRHGTERRVAWKYLTHGSVDLFPGSVGGGHTDQLLQKTQNDLAGALLVNKSLKEQLTTEMESNRAMEQQKCLDYSRIKKLEKELRVSKNRSETLEIEIKEIRRVTTLRHSIDELASKFTSEKLRNDVVRTEIQKLEALQQKLEVKVRVESERLEKLRKECAELDDKKKMKKKICEAMEIDLARKRAQQTQIEATTSLDSPEVRALRDIQERDGSIKIYTTHSDKQKPPIRAGGKVYWSKSKNMWAHYGSGGSRKEEAGKEEARKEEARKEKADVMFPVRAARPQASATSKVRTLTIRIPSSIKNPSSIKKSQVGVSPPKKVSFNETGSCVCLD